MSTFRALKFDAAGNQLADDATDHAYLRDLDTGKEYLEPLLGPVTHDQIGKIAAECDIAGGGWRPATVKENVASHDYTRFGPVLDRSLFPSAPEYGGVWAAEDDASDRESDAWVVFLAYGSIVRYNQYYRFWVRLVRGPVASGQ